MIVQGILIIMGASGAYLAWSFLTKLKSDTHTTVSALKHNVVNLIMRIIGRRRRRKLELETKNVEKAQEKFLLDALSKQKLTVYGQEQGFELIKSRDEFIRKHPLTRYDVYASYIDRIYNGEENVLTATKPKILAMTSGTSGKSSMLPTTKDVSSLFFMNGLVIMYDTMATHFSGFNNLQKSLKFVYMPKFRESPAGIPVGPNSWSPKYQAPVSYMYTTPMDAFDILTESEAIYIHLLFGLRDRNVGMVEATFAQLIYVAFQHLKQQWPRLVNDIRTGNIDKQLNLDVAVRQKLERLLTANPRRADELKVEFLKGFHEIAKRIWPHVNFVLTVDTGSAELYGTLLRAEECSGIPFFSPLYAASEGLLALNLNPRSEEREYTLLPSNLFFEFIPIEHADEDQPDTLLLHQVEQGETYEVVITNITGLYRYRMGDVVKVTSFHNQSPNIQFLYRQGQFLNVRGEKTSEKLFYDNLTKVAEKWPDVQIRDYCCVESALALPYINAIQDPNPFYVVFLEAEGPTLTSQQHTQLDTAIQETSYVYKSFRVKRGIAPLQIYAVPGGTFQQLKRHLIENTTVSSNQYKVPRVLKKPDVVKFMFDCYEKEKP